MYEQEEDGWMKRIVDRINSELEEELHRAGEELSKEITSGIFVVPDGAFVVPAGNDICHYVPPASSGGMSDGYVVFISDQVKAALKEQTPTAFIVARDLLHECALTMTMEQWTQLSKILEFDPGQEKWKTVL